MTEEPRYLNWLAGLFEVGGFVSIVQRRKKKYAYVQFEGPPAIVQRLYKLVEETGSVSQREGREVARWSAIGDGAAEFLKAIQPYVYGPRSKKITQVLKNSGD